MAEQRAVWQTENINMKFCLFYISYKTDLAKSLISGRYFVSIVLIIDVKYFFSADDFYR